MMVNSTNSTLNITVQVRPTPLIFLNYTANPIPWYVSDGSIFGPTPYCCVFKESLT
ncbi:MAG: hypothetical protein MjAS7_0144 [Metallosphaera javensis (ex Sakai et al. 2022)]|nr:MAG: hypothetical protein MjAS7_0144 [Metallosphaera javensis (ex Sakai et al. 2022)]